MQVLSGKTLIDTYDRIFTNNYNKLKYAVSDNQEDLLHQVYIKNRKRFENNNVFTATTNVENQLLNYISLSIHNHNKTVKKQESVINKLELDNEAEIKLLRNEKQEHDEKIYEKQLQFLIQELFKYVERNYSQAEFYIFRVYYLYDEKNKMTYKRLSEITGYSMSTVCNIIKTIKKDVKKNLINDINNKK